MPSSSVRPTPKRVRGERQRLQDAQFRQRKKQERQQLRETAQQLEVQLVKLRESANGGEIATSPLHKKRKSFFSCGDGQSKAEAMKQQRIEAEQENMTLRRVLAKEQKVAKSLVTIMNTRPRIPALSRSVMGDMRTASCSQTDTMTRVPQCSQCCSPTTLHINPSAVGLEIEATLRWMHGKADEVLKTSTPNDSLSFDSRIQLDAVSGPMTKVASTTPVNCTLDQAVKLLGSKFHVQRRINLIGPRCAPGRRHDGGELQFTVQLGAPYQIVLLDGFASSRRSEDLNRRLVLWAAISFDRCGALCFRECTWLAIYRSAQNPAGASVIRSHYSLTAEKATDCVMIDGECIEKVRDRALRAMGKQIKERYLAMQRGILLQTGQGDLVGFIGA